MEGGRVESQMASSNLRSQGSDRFKVISAKDGLTLLEEIATGRLVFERKYSLNSSDVDAFSAETYLSTRVLSSTSELTLRVLDFEASADRSLAAAEKRSGIVRYEAFAQTLGKEFVEHVKNSWRWRERELVNTMRCALGGLRELHVNGVTHGDLRMNSIVLSEGNSVKLADQFAINFNTVSAPKSLRKDSKMLVATCALLPPECMERIIDSNSPAALSMTPAADLWALGVILLEMMLLENVHSSVYDFANKAIKRDLLEKKMAKAKSYFSRKSKLIVLLDTLLMESVSKRLDAYKFIEETEQASIHSKSVSFKDERTRQGNSDHLPISKSSGSESGSSLTSASHESADVEDQQSILSSIIGHTEDLLQLQLGGDDESQKHDSKILETKDAAKWKIAYVDDNEFLDVLMHGSSRSNGLNNDSLLKNVQLESSHQELGRIRKGSNAGAGSSANAVDLVSMRVETNESERSDLTMNPTLNAIDRLFIADDISSIASVGPQQIVNTFGLVVQDSQCCTSSSSSSDSSKLGIHSIRPLEELSFDMISIPPLDEEVGDAQFHKRGPDVFMESRSSKSNWNFLEERKQQPSIGQQLQEKNVDTSNVFGKKPIASNPLVGHQSMKKEEARDYYVSQQIQQNEQQQSRGVFLLGKQGAWNKLKSSKKQNSFDSDVDKENKIDSINLIEVDRKVRMLDALCEQALERSIRNRENISQQQQSSSLSQSQSSQSSSSTARKNAVFHAIRNDKNISQQSSISYVTDQSLLGDESRAGLQHHQFNHSGRSLQQLQEELNSQLRMHRGQSACKNNGEEEVIMSARSSLGQARMQSREENLRLSAHFGQLALTHLAEYIAQQQQQLELQQLSSRREETSMLQSQSQSSSSMQGLVRAGSEQLQVRRLPHSLENSQYRIQSNQRSNCCNCSCASSAHESDGRLHSMTRPGGNDARDEFHMMTTTAMSHSLASNSDSITSLVAGIQSTTAPAIIPQFSQDNRFSNSEIQLFDQGFLPIGSVDHNNQLKRGRIQLLGTGKASSVSNSSFKRIL